MMLPTVARISASRRSTAFLHRRNFCSSQDDGNKNNETNNKIDDLLGDFKKKKEEQATKKAAKVKLAKPKEISPEERKKLDTRGVHPEAAAAAQSVSKHLAGNDERKTSKRIESDILKKLRSLAKETEKSKANAAGEDRSELSDLIGTFKVEKKKALNSFEIRRRVNEHLLRKLIQITYTSNQILKTIDLLDDNWRKFPSEMWFQ